MLGPFKMVNGLEEHSDLKVKVGERVFYKCYDGKVLNTQTNQRTFWLTCKEDLSLQGDLKSARCLSPTHCVGPLDSNDPLITHVSPERDASVNSRVGGFCMEEEFIFGSCFPDGVVRFPYDCEDPAQMTDSCSREPVFISLTGENSFGWIQVASPASSSGEPSIASSSPLYGILSAVHGVLNGEAEGEEEEQARSDSPIGLDGSYVCNYRYVSGKTRRDIEDRHKDIKFWIV